jgi:hypothetical protein
VEKVYTDVLGREIRFTKERYDYIVQFHPEILRYIETVDITLGNPEFIIQSNTDNTVELFYHYFVNTSLGDKWLCVVVKLLQEDYFIITVYFTDKIKKGEIKWKKN